MSANFDRLLGRTAGVIDRSNVGNTLTGEIVGWSMNGEDVCLVVRRSEDGALYKACSRVCEITVSGPNAGPKHFNGSAQ